MATTEARKLSLDEFHARYVGEKPYFEYWDGEAIQKSPAMWSHGRVQGVVASLLDALGYDSALEVTLKLDPAYEPIPDVIAMEHWPTGPYPTEPFEVVVEILSPEDPFSRVLRKCRLYEKWGIRQIVVIDPEERLVWRFENSTPVETDVIASRAEAKIQAQALWDEVDRRKP